MMPRYAASILERFLVRHLNTEHLNLNTPQRGSASMASSIDAIRAPGLSLRRPSMDRRGLAAFSIKHMTSYFRWPSEPAVRFPLEHGAQKNARMDTARSWQHRHAGKLNSVNQSVNWTRPRFVVHQVTLLPENKILCFEVDNN